MNKLHFIYRPATKEYLQFIDLKTEYGPHCAWSRDRANAFPFETREEASRVAETIARADKIRTQIITFREEGRNTIECA